MCRHNQKRDRSILDLPECRQLPKTVKRLEQLMPYVSENEKLRKQLEENTKDEERLQAENNRLRKRISTTEEQNRLESVTRATTSGDSTRN